MQGRNGPNRDGDGAALETSLGGTHLVILYDITERKRHEREAERLNRLYAALSQINQTIMRMPAREELLQQVCRVLVEQGEFQIAWIGRHAPESHRLVPVAAWGDQGGYLQSVGGYLYR